MTVIGGWVLAGIAFLVVGAVWNALFGGDLALPMACVAGFLTWKFFDDKYKKGLTALLNPPAEVWPLSMPDAWTCIKDVLASSYVQSDRSGISNWRIQTEDNTRGIIQAQISFQQVLGAGKPSDVYPRAIVLHAQLSPDGDRTKVAMQYQIVSPMGTGMVEEVIRKTQQDFRSRAKMIRDGQ